jgi:thiol-disulfide isomerase/thioredoxin
MRNLIYCLSLILFFVSCSDSELKDVNKPSLPKNFEIDGEILGAANQQIFVEAQSARGVIKIAESQTEVDGTFHIEGNIKGFGLYQLRVGKDQIKSVPLTLCPKDKIRVNANYATFEQLPKISGAKWTSAITKYMQIFNEFAYKQMALINDKSLKEEDKIKQFFEIKKPLDVYAKSQMLKNPSNPANIVLTTSMTPAMGFENWDVSNLEVLNTVLSAYKSSYPSSPITRSLEMQIEQIKNAYAEFKGTNTASQTEKAPEINLPDPTGKKISLSSLRGKVVLIDFWASWCAPCRQENPNVVALYNKYKNKNFTIFSVSLDKDKEAWKKAIKSDGLVWKTHVSDLLQWETPLVQQYGFNSIPFTVLIDANGVIVGKNLQGEVLEQMIVSLLKL